MQISKIKLFFINLILKKNSENHTIFIENLILYLIQQILSFYIISYKIKIIL